MTAFNPRLRLVSAQVLAHTDTEGIVELLTVEHLSKAVIEVKGFLFGFPNEDEELNLRKLCRWWLG
jgi:hypothetical protein